MRHGRRTCEGFHVQSPGAGWRKREIRKHLRVIELKHSSDMLDLMEATFPDSKTLRVVFAEGKGDFGSGNAVEIRIALEALGGTGHISLPHVATDLPITGGIRPAQESP